VFYRRITFIRQKENIKFCTKDIRIMEIVTAISHRMVLIMSHFIFNNMVKIGSTLHITLIQNFYSSKYLTCNRIGIIQIIRHGNKI